jgi:hypothetical protein
VAKVKKTAVVTGIRNVKASKKARKKASKGPVRKSRAGAGAKAVGKARAGRPALAKPGAGAAKKPGAGVARRKAKVGKNATKASRARIQARVPMVRISVKRLEPQAKCGAATSVQHLYRVDETVDGRTTTHLVFFDRHGWYCEHGRNCPAVGHAKKYQGHIARAS